MALTDKQIIALQELPRIGKKKVLDLGSKITGFISDEELCDYFLGLQSAKSSRSTARLTEQDFKQALKQAEIKLDKTQQAGISWISCYDASYPAVLNDVMSEDGKRSESPVMLYYKGDLQLLSSASIAIIGSRNASPQAEKAATFLAKNFAARGLPIVSGLALGCDTAAHLGALAAESGKTIAVLGNGLDSVYPSENSDLAAQILAQGGLLISEYALGQKAANYTLVARDLIQAGISKAVIVAQSKIDGGSMHAAIAAANSGKHLYAVKYSDLEFDSSDCNRGNHELVQKYGAAYITATKDKIQMSSYLDAIAKEILG